MEDDKIKIEDEIKHFQECGYLKSIGKEAIIEIEAKRKRAVETQKQFEKLIKELNKWNFIWFLKYTFRQ